MSKDKEVVGSIKPPFDITIMDKEPVKVFNELSGESVVLTPQATAVYDAIRGAEMMGYYKTVRQGLDWFRKYYTDEYMVLLD